jgi:AcrR family transcriptional regulator
MPRVHKPQKATKSRTRNATATRAAILASARHAFAQSGYDGAGVREIAAGAGVTAMLVNRYFGSKEKLFAEVVDDTMKDPTILTPENLAAPDLALRMASALVGLTGSGTTPLDGFLIMLRSTGSGRAAQIARAQIGKRHLKNMAQTLGGDHPAERAAMALSLVAGFQVMRQMIALPALAKADAKVLVDILTPLFAQLIREP